MAAEKTIRLIKRQTLPPHAWVRLMRIWWTLLGNGAATVLFIYGVYLIVVHH